MCLGGRFNNSSSASSLMRRRRILVVLLTSLCVGLLFAGWTRLPCTAQISSCGILPETRTLTVAPLQIVPTHNPDSGSVKVLLLAYFRTGSTFTAELFHQTPGSFYTFEPLHSLFTHYRRQSLSPKLLNGTSWYRILEGYELPYARHLLDSLLHCDIAGVDKLTLLSYSKKSAVLSNFRACLHKLKSNSSKVLEICVPEVREACLKAPIRIVKTIRTSMRMVSDMLQRDPSLKIVHLLRDPRGHIRSWMRHDGKDGKLTEVINGICNRIRDDLEVRQGLQIKYPGSFMEVIYEDISQHPMDVLDKLYNWLGIEVQPGVKAWLRNSTANTADGNFVQTYRRNSTETAYQWARNISFGFVKIVNKYCKDLIDYGDFPPFSSENELKTFRVPNRPLT